MEGKLHARALFSFCFKGDRILAEGHPEEIRVIGIMEDLIAHRG